MSYLIIVGSIACFLNVYMSWKYKNTQAMLGWLSALFFSFTALSVLPA